MRKKIIDPVQQQQQSSERDWLDIEQLADIEISSEDDAYPIESALLPSIASSWRASGPGEQTIRLIFKQPQKLKLIRLSFEESSIERTQEYVLRWSPDDGKSYQEIVRQQWNFNPHGSTRETEEYQVDLPAVTVLELVINPDITGKNAVASLDQLRLS
ncbi:MAG: carbohydrate-binding protein [Gammaproteobacteria bacterium]